MNQYPVLFLTEENFWSILYLTRYLTCVRPEELPADETLAAGQTALRIPNEEVKAIFAETVVEWFRDNMK